MCLRSGYTDDQIFDWFFTELGNTVRSVSQIINDLSRFDSEHWFEKVILRTTSHYD